MCEGARSPVVTLVGTQQCFSTSSGVTESAVYLCLFAYLRVEGACMCKSARARVCVYSLPRRALQTSNDTLRNVSTPKKAPLVGRKEEKEEEGEDTASRGVAADC